MSDEQTVVVLQPAMGSYRQEFLRALEDQGAPVEFLVGDRHFVESVRTGVESPLVTSTGANVFVLGRRLGFQRGVTRRAVAAAVCVVELNPRNPNTWVVAGVRRLLGRRTWAWGHVWPRGGSGSRSDRLRGAVRRLTGHVLVYTAEQAAELKRHSPTVTVGVVPNSLYRAADLGPSSDAEPDRFVWVGRLVPEKNPLLVVEAFRRYRQDGGRLRLSIIGDGALRADVDDAIIRHGLSDQVTVLGWVDDRRCLQDQFSRSAALLCTGYAGLNVTQSLGFGCPVVYAAGERHSPELCLLDAGNSMPFPSGDAAGLAAAMARSQAWPVDRSAVAQAVAQEYSADAMARAFSRHVAVT
ncbi:hypothetical protein GCM10027047_34290 [Rhodococcus aerolatus]